MALFAVVFFVALPVFGLAWAAANDIERLDRVAERRNLKRERLMREHRELVERTLGQHGGC